MPRGTLRGMRLKLGQHDSEHSEALRRGISVSTPTAAIRAILSLYVADNNFRDDVNAAAKRNNVDKDGRLTK